MQKIHHASCAVLILFSWCLAACSPQYDWREVRGSTAPFSVLLPAKPATLAQSVNLDGQQVMMTMTAAEVDGITFAVGTATLPDAEKALAGIISMKTALVKNISGSIKQEKSTDDKASHTVSTEIEAVGQVSTSGKDQPMQLFARFIAKDKQIYQVVIVGRGNTVSQVAVDTFFTSFKLN